MSQTVVNGVTFVYIKGEGWVTVEPPPQPINDGFGDDLTVAETLREYEGWLHRRAHQMVNATQVLPTAEDHDDLVQRGFIAMWNALGTYEPVKGALPSWLTLKASGAMLDAVRPRHKHLQPDTLPDSWEDTPESLIEEPDLLAGIVSAYHRGEVAKALDRLTPRQREYVHLRFWEGKSTRALTEHFGYDPSGLWNSPRNGAKFKLREALAHLVAA